jgi:hypothetical protein
MKGTALVSGVNVKNTSSGLVVTTLNKGEVVFGDYSSSNSDLINVENVYQSDGVTLRMALGQSCKVSIQGLLSVVAGTEPSPSPTPTPTPTPTPSPVTPTLTHTIQVFDNGQISIDGGVLQ